MSSEFHNRTFPPDFIWGLATSAYQTEGAWNSDGKGENIWDKFCHNTPEKIKDKSNGDNAMNSYHMYKEDVQLLKNMGAKMYRFSISWARILPHGTLEKINQAGIDYYNNLINELIANGIEPMITIFHWDLPTQDINGWENSQIVSIFGEYARLCFEKFGDRVRYFVTINEPYICITKAYEHGFFAPGIKEPGTKAYQCVHNMIKSHALAYRIYNEEFREKQKGFVGLAVDTSYYGPLDPNSKEDCEAADKAYEFRLGWIASPPFTGDYPTIMKESIAAKNPSGKSRLPEFDAEWSERIKGSVDFLGVNYYTGELVTFDKSKSLQGPSWESDLSTIRTRDEKWKKGGAVWQRDVPTGLRHTLKWIKNKYNNPMVLITENGNSDTIPKLEDDDRVNYFKGHINETLKAIDLDGCNVKGYLAWCLLDVWEWADGYTVGFGVHAVDRENGKFTRTPKKSAKYLTEIFAKNGFPM